MIRKIIAMAVLAGTSFYTSAWDGSVTGTIGVTEVAGETNYAFRVWLNESTPLCGTEHRWAFINKADSNYETFVAMLIAAKFAKSSVTLYTNKTDKGYCRIGHLVAR